MILSAHQLDFCPYSGFWKKMANSNVFDVMIFSQFKKDNYSNRVRIGEKLSWLNVKVEEHLIPMNEILMIESSQEKVFNDLEAEYKNSLFFKKYRNELWEITHDTKYKYFWEFSWRMLLFIKKSLKIETPVAIGRDTTLKKSEALIEKCKIYNADKYLSGSGGKEYLDIDLFLKNGIVVDFLEHEVLYSGSVLHLMFTEEKPMEKIMR